ncbi:MAG: ribosome small subunit-dependent GTPase A [Chloroflexi bacterium]|nr:ribosome small subunit-dependent GTPase A [Chloroflexota bacterium]
MTATLDGLIIKAQSGFFTVHTEAGNFACQVRGKLKQRRLASDLTAVGDRVTISTHADGAGMIEEIEPRRSALSRRSPAGRDRVGPHSAAGEKEQVIVANPDQVVFVFAVAEPAPRLGMLDRFLVVAEASQLPAVICFNKTDITSETRAQEMFSFYESLGYPVIYTSARNRRGLDALRERLRDRLSVLAGPSGVGKSSLLNALQPGLGLAAKAISRATSKGRHTTVVPELLPLLFGGWVADTPGLRALALFDIEPDEVDGYFVEIRPLVSQCEFNDCTHLRERGCAVQAAVERGEIARSRYESYRKLREL